MRLLLLEMAITSTLGTSRGREATTTVDAITEINNSSGEGVTRRMTGWTMTTKTMASR